MAALNFLHLSVFCLTSSSLVFSSEAGTRNGSKGDACGPWLPNTTIAVKILKEVDGKWKTSYYAHKRMRDPYRVLDLNLEHEVISCGETKYMALSGRLKDTDVDKMLEDSGKEAASDVDAQNKGDARSRQSPMESDMIFLNKSLGEIFILTKKLSGRMEETESRLDSMENALQSFNERMYEMKNMLKNVLSYSYFMHFDRLIKGKKIELYNNLRTAIRIKPHEDEGAYGGVVSNNPLRDDVAFQVRFDETIDEWRAFGIALGVIVKKDEAVKEKHIYICFNVPGAYCIASWSSDKGKSHIYKDNERRYNAYNLDTRYLPVGTTLGVVRRSNNALHFLLNGADQGAAFDNIPDGVYAFVDVKDYVYKITIIS